MRRRRPRALGLFRDKRTERRAPARAAHAAAAVARLAPLTMTEGGQQVRPLDVTMRRTYDGHPLAVVHGLPGDGAELRPDQMRALAAALNQAADVTETRAKAKRGRLLPDERRTFGCG